MALIVLTDGVDGKARQAESGKRWKTRQEESRAVSEQQRGGWREKPKAFISGRDGKGSRVHSNQTDGGAGFVSEFAVS
jgi:hypothetical protein